MKNKLFSIIILTLLASVSNADNALYKDPVTGIELILVKGGCFEMGDVPRGRDTDRGPAHNVCVSNFYMGKYEVTQKQWVTVMGNNPSFFKTGDNYPVEHISFVDAQVFLNRLKELTGKPYRLPTEAEWEYAARAGGKRAQYAGAINDHDIDKYVWYKPNAGHKTHPVGKKMPNELGLYDM